MHVENKVLNAVAAANTLLIVLTFRDICALYSHTSFKLEFRFKRHSPISP